MRASTAADLQALKDRVDADYMGSWDDFVDAAFPHGVIAPQPCEPCGGYKYKEPCLTCDGRGYGWDKVKVKEHINAVARELGMAEGDGYASQELASFAWLVVRAVLDAAVTGDTDE